MLICTPTVECQDFKQEELLLPMNILQLGNEFLMRKMEIKSNEKINIVVYSDSQATFSCDLHYSDSDSEYNPELQTHKLEFQPNSEFKSILTY